MKIDAKKFDRIAKDVFAPVYPMIADQIVARTGVADGVCLDIGCGGGDLGAALIKVSGLSVVFLDQSADMLAIARRVAGEDGLGERTGLLLGDVSAIPLADDSVDLAVSRGSVFFWDDLPRAFAEIHRVLAPGGQGYIGGGFGSKKVREAIEREMLARNQGKDTFGARVRRNLGPETRARFEMALERAGLHGWETILDEETGLWVLMRK